MFSPSAFQLRGLQGLLQADGAQGADVRVPREPRLHHRQAAAQPLSGMNFIKIGLPGKSFSETNFQDNMTSRRPFLLLRISFPGRPIFMPFLPVLPLHEVPLHRHEARGGAGGAHQSRGQRRGRRRGWKGGREQRDGVVVHRQQVRSLIARSWKE